MSFIPVSLLPVVAVVLVVVLVVSLRYQSKVLEDKKWLDRAWPVNIDEIIHVVGRCPFDSLECPENWDFNRRKTAERDLAQFFVVAAMFKFWPPTRPLVPHSDALLLYRRCWENNSHVLISMLWALGLSDKPLASSFLENKDLQIRTKELINQVFWNATEIWSTKIGARREDLLRGDLRPFLRAPGNPDQAVSWTKITTRQLLQFLHQHP